MQLFRDEHNVARDVVEINQGHNKGLATPASAVRLGQLICLMLFQCEVTVALRKGRR